MKPLLKDSVLKIQVGQPITSYQDNKLTIVGVVKDALMLSPFGEADPTMFHAVHDPQGVMLYKLSPRIKTQDAIKQLTAIFNKYNPSTRTDYSFEDENYAAKFKLESLIGKLSGLFAGLAIFISCLGLFGLAAYIAGATHQGNRHSQSAGCICSAGLAVAFKRFLLCW
jgi:hypothetical protein